MLPVLDMRNYSQYAVEYLTRLLGRHSASPALSVNEYLSAMDSILRPDVSISNLLTDSLQRQARILRVSCKKLLHGILVSSLHCSLQLSHYFLLHPFFRKLQWMLHLMPNWISSSSRSWTDWAQQTLMPTRRRYASTFEDPHFQARFHPSLNPSLIIFADSGVLVFVRVCWWPMLLHMEANLLLKVVRKCSFTAAYR